MRSAGKSRPAGFALISEGFSSETDPAVVGQTLFNLGTCSVVPLKGNVTTNIGVVLAKFGAPKRSRTFFSWYDNCVTAPINHLQRCKIVQGTPEGWEGFSGHTPPGTLIKFDAGGLPAPEIIDGVTGRRNDSFIRS